MPAPAALATLTLSSLLLQATPPSVAHEPEFVLESNTPQLKVDDDGVMTLAAGDGWLRTRHVYADFVLTFEMRAAKETRAVVGVRNWPGHPDGWPQRGYMIHLAGGSAGQMAGRRAKVTRTSFGRYQPEKPGDWQTVTLECVRDAITMGINRQFAGSFAIEELAGVILFAIDKGALELRNVSVRELEYRNSVPNDVYPLREKPPGLAAPVLKKQVNALYPPESLRKRVEGLVELEAVVLEDGAVGSVNVVKSPDRDLAVASVAALRRWRFAPGTLDGKPVKVRITVEMTYKVK